MIKRFRHKGLERLFKTGSTAGVPAQFAQKIADILQLLETATCPEDMNSACGLHPLKPPRKGDWSVVITRNWRVTWQFTDDGDVDNVNYEDYH